ncbi:putative arylsulfatase precursor protein [Neofusicoccum parvum]|uniref:Arylsulfatase protein n=1 Tax=Neofusicoccum parvum TaxID=310453 RepID=A0ACB5SAJ0_9PEZI|nr:putative arylsulfatase precursor protein [Neofusicoccum parvum]
MFLTPSLLAVAVSSLLWRHGRSADVSQPASPRRPNIVFIMADDQDKRMDSLDYQPLLDKNIRRHGTEFRAHYCTIAQCCPSRASLWTGKAAHNTNVTDTRPPYGGWPKFVQEGHNENYLPIWLQDAGYSTYYIGKMMNGLSTSNYNNPYPAGWNGTDFLITPNLYQYFNASFQRNQEPPRYHPDDYSTDLVTQSALAYLDAATAGGASGGAQPFFMAISPIGPHSSAVILPDRPIFSLPVAAPRHQGLFRNASVPRTPGFNPSSQPGHASWVAGLPVLNGSEVAYGDEFYRRRLEALQAVDELVDAVVTKLGALGVLDDTYVFYTSDNGFHIGQHRLPPGKSCGFEEDILVPMFVRGPGVAKNATVDFPTTHTDIAPTIFELAGIGLRGDFDGVPMPVREDDLVQAGTDFPNNTYKFLRIVGESYSLAYSVWCTNEHELYDLKTDPYQLRNLLAPANYNTTLLSLPLPTVVHRLDTLLMVLKSCAGTSCTQPWQVLHPDQDVHTLADALDERYDGFYAAQKRVAFSECALGYIRGVEGPMQVMSWQGETGEGYV